MTTTKNASTATIGRRYGLISMLAMIVGVVIGSGIFVKNEQLWLMTDGSALESMIAWFVVSIIVIFMLISFIEISSITTKTNEQGTLANWTRHLWGEGTSKFVGFLFPIVYFPTLIAGLSVFSSDYLVRGIEMSTGPLELGNLGTNTSNFMITSMIGLGTIIMLFTMNSFTNRPGKVAQTSGTFLKLIPLFGIVIIGIMASIAPSLVDSTPNDIKDIFDPNSQLNHGWGETKKENINTILLILPAVMFSFDGFLYAASLSREAKKPSTYKVAAVTGVTFIAVIFIAVTLFAFVMGDPGDINDKTNPGDMTITSGFTRAFTNQPWIGPLVTYLIFISMITGISGNMILTQRMLAGLSYNRYLVDRNGILIKRNNSGIPTSSGLVSMGMTIFVFIVLRSMDGAVLTAMINDGVPEASQSTASITGWATDLVIVTSFSIYALIIIGGIKNRFTYTVYTKRSKAFLPASILVVPLMALILTYFVQDVFKFNFEDQVDVVVSSLKITFLLLFAGVWWVFALISNSKTKNAKFTPTQEWNRRVYNYAYTNVLTVNEAQEVIAKQIPKELGAKPKGVKLNVRSKVVKKTLTSKEQIKTKGSEIIPNKSIPKKTVNKSKTKKVNTKKINIKKPWVKKTTTKK